MKWIAKGVDSIVKSSFKTDLIIIDNGSTDGTLEFLRENDKIFYLHESKKNLGFGKANNIGLQLGFSHGYDYFLLLNQDAWIEEHTIESLIENLEKHPGFGIVSPMHFNGTGSAFDHLFKSYLSRTPSYQEDFERNSVKELYESPFINAACWLMRRKTLEIVGLFHPLYDHYGEDDNYLNRLFFQNLKLGLNTRVRMFHDRDSGVNPIKDDPYHLYKRSVLSLLLDPGNKVRNNEIRQKARSIARKLSRQLPMMSRIIFKMRCKATLNSISKDVDKFAAEREKELFPKMN